MNNMCNEYKAILVWLFGFDVGFSIVGFYLSTYLGVAEFVSVFEAVIVGVWTGWVALQLAVYWELIEGGR